VVAPHWREIRADIGRDLVDLYQSGLWHQALLHGQGRPREPAPEDWGHDDNEALFWAGMLLGGSAPPWVPRVLPRMRVRLQLDADERCVEETFVVDPQRVRGGAEAYRQRLEARLGQLPLPFAGWLVVSLEDPGSGQRLALRSWWMEIGTQLPIHDPDVRVLLAEQRRTMRELRYLLRERDELVRKTVAAMNFMFRQSADVIQASAGLVEKAAELRLMARRLERAEVGPGLLEIMEQALPLLAPAIQSLMGDDGGSASQQPWAPYPNDEPEEPGEVEPQPWYDDETDEPWDDDESDEPWDDDESEDPWYGDEPEARPDDALPEPPEVRLFRMLHPSLEAEADRLDQSRRDGSR